MLDASNKKLLAELNKHLHNTSGLLIEVGANDGLWKSVSHELIFRGWSAILLEPYIESFQKLQSLYKTMGRVQCIKAAASNKAGKSYLYLDNRRSSRQTCATLESQLCPGHNHSGERVLVDTITVESLSHRCDLLIIDAEGHDFEVLEGLGRLRPYLIVSEIFSYLPQKYKKKLELLCNLGYCKIGAYGYDELFVFKPSLCEWPHHQASRSSNDTFFCSIHPTSKVVCGPFFHKRCLICNPELARKCGLCNMLVIYCCC